jgi:uncharacterized protein (UPF0332 family)
VKQEFLNKAEENLKIAQISFENECYNACATRAYFSAFQVAIAALAHKGCLAKGKNDHAFVNSEFNLRLIKRQKIYPAKFRTYLPNMQAERNVADYSEQNISKKVAYKLLSQATEMIGFVEKELNR